MSLEREVRLIHPVAWVLAALCYFSFAGFFYLHVMRTDASMMQWPEAGKILFAFGIPIFMTCFILLVGYVNGDAKRRGMRRVMWTLLALLIPNGIGIILYFILRDPLAAPCPKCSAPSRPGFAFCPQCGATLAPACPQCKHAVEPNWANCAYCGVKLN